MHAQHPCYFLLQLAEVTGIRRVQQARSSPGRSNPSSRTLLDVKWFYYPEETLMKAKVRW
jgi:hypothetical protein